MYCEECGHILNENGVCPICGWSIVSANAQQTASQSAGQHTYNTFQNNPYSDSRPQNNQYSGNQFQNWQASGNQYGNAQQPSADTYTVRKRKWPIVAGIIGLTAVLSVSVALLQKNKVKDYTTTESTSVTTEATYTTGDTAESTTEAKPPAEAGTKTIMLYMVGSDLESKYAAASDDINEILNSGYNDEKINILIYSGGCSDWDINEIPDNANTLFLVEDGKLNELESEASKNMGEPDTLSEFLNYGYENYPAEQYSVILWNHGGGSFSGFGYDELTNDCLTLKELNEAFSQSPFNSDNKLEWIGFDACLMASIETADALSPFANYLVASQEPEPGWGWDYSFLADIDSIDSGDEIGTIITDTYIGTTEEYFEHSPFSYSSITLSVLDLSHTADVEAALNSLFVKADNALDNATFTKYSRIRAGTKEIAAEFTGEYSYDVVDLTDLAKKMEAEFITEATALEAALSKFIVYSSSNESNANGVSIYYPYNAKEYSSYYIPMYQSFDFASDYANYISNFASLLTGTDTLTAEWDPETMIPTANGDMTFSLQLTPEQAASCQNAYYVISRADTATPGNYIFVSMSNQVNMSDSNLLTADFDGQIIYMQNDSTQEQYEVMYTEQESTDEYTRYLLSSILFDENIQEEDAMYAYFVLETTESNPEGSIIGAYPIANLISGNGTDLFPDRYEIDLSDYENIAFGSFTHEFTSTEDLTNFNESDWSDLQLLYNNFPISDGFSTVMDGMIPEVPYFGMFIIEDTQGNRHCSNLVQIQ